MRLPTLHCIHYVHLVLAVCLLTGCWEKIEYRGTFPETAKSGSTPAPPAAVGDSPNRQPQPAPAVNERYSVKVESNPAAPPGTPAEAPPTEASATETPPTEVQASDPSAIAVSAAVEATSPPASSTKRAVWVLGSKFSLAALANDRGIVPEDVQKWFEEANSMAASLNFPLAALPERPATPQSEAPSREVLGYILNQEKAIGERLAADYGDEHDAIFRMAMRTNLLRVLNTPGSKAVEALSKSIADLGPRSGLPIGLWQPLLDLLNQGAASAAIRTAVPQMHADVDRHLAAEQ